MGLLHIDHMVGNVGWNEMNPFVDFYRDVMGFGLYQHFDDADISTEYSSLMSKVMSDGEICTASCGVSFAVDVFANPAQPLSTVPPHSATANIAAIPHRCRLLALNSLTPFVFAPFTLAMSSPPPLHSVRQSTAQMRVKNTGWMFK